MIEFGFVRVIFLAAVVAIVLQCAVYPVRRIWGMATAYRMLRSSLFGFLGAAAGCLLWGAWTGDLWSGLAEGGWKTLVDLALFIGFTMFISYFMAERYLSDELERARERSVKGNGAREQDASLSREPGIEE